jgi:hypothetical protein
VRNVEQAAKGRKLVERYLQLMETNVMSLCMNMPRCVLGESLGESESGKQMAAARLDNPIKCQIIQPEAIIIAQMDHQK